MNDRALDRLFRRFRDRSDGAALAAVFDATARELLEVACHLIRDPVEAEDLVQATFQAAIRRAKTYDSSSPLKGWLYGILWREAAKVRRDSARSLDPLRVTERREPEPIEGLLALEMPEAVDRALARLPLRYREVLEPVIHEGRQPDEIARALGRSPGTVRSQISRGMERLRRALPADFVPVSSLAAVSLRGLEGVRAEVLQSAGFSPAVAAAAPALALNATIGGVLMSKGVLAGAAAVVAVGAAAWFALEGSPPRNDERLSSLTSISDAVAAAEPSARPGDTGGLAATQREDARETLESSLERAAPSPQDAVEHWLARFGEAPDDWRHGWSVAEEIAKLPPDEALRIMTAVWPHLTVAIKEQALKPFVFHGGHPRALKVLHLAACDSSLSVQGRAFDYLESYAFQDFANDYEAYVRWAATYGDMPVKDVLTANATRMVDDLLALPPAKLAERVRALDLDLGAGGPEGVDLAAVIREAGGLHVLSACLQGDDPEAKRRALDWSKTLQADETWLRTWVLPSIEIPAGTDPEVLHASFDALGRPECGWAKEPILEHLRRAAQVDAASGEHPLATSAAARALADIGDPAAIPAMIEILLHDRSGTLAYDVGYFGLAKLAEVHWQESYDGAWWLDWWEKNYRRMPPEAQAFTIRR